MSSCVAQQCIRSSYNFKGTSLTPFPGELIHRSSQAGGGVFELRPNQAVTHLQLKVDFPAHYATPPAVVASATAVMNQILPVSVTFRETSDGKFQGCILTLLDDLPYNSVTYVSYIVRPTHHA